MYGSYGSYSSMGASSAPMDIGKGSYLSTPSYDSSCAFPSWPRRSSLSESSCEYRATSFLSDDDLFPQDVFEDDAQSIASSSSTASPQPGSPQIMTEADLLEMQRERMAAQREVMRLIMSEKERRRQQAKRRGSSGSKKSPKSKLSSMTPITETGE